jgi:hypothetical protein
MSLDVAVPDPPSLRGPRTRGEYEAIDAPADESESGGDDYRREDLAGILAEGAWPDAFEEWAAGTTLSEEEFETVQSLELVDEAGYRPPELSGEASEAFDDPDGVEAELDTLGRILTEVLENDYLLRDEETFGFFADDYTGEPGNEE